MLRREPCSIDRWKYDTPVVSITTPVYIPDTRVLNKYVLAWWSEGRYEAQTGEVIRQVFLYRDARARWFRAELDEDRNPMHYYSLSIWFHKLIFSQHCQQPHSQLSPPNPESGQPPPSPLHFHMMCTRRELELEPVDVCLRLLCHDPVRYGSSLPYLLEMSATSIVTRC